MPASGWNCRLLPSEPALPDLCPEVIIRPPCRMGVKLAGLGGGALSEPEPAAPRPRLSQPGNGSRSPRLRGAVVADREFTLDSRPATTTVFS